MQRLIVTVFLAFVLLSVSFAQETEKEKEQPKKMTKQQPSKVYWGGQLGLSFGSYFRISIIHYASKTLGAYICSINN